MRQCIASFGLGITITIFAVSQFGQSVSVALGFVGGILFTVSVGIVTGIAVVWCGQRFGWVRSYVSQHSQHGGDE